MTLAYAKLAWVIGPIFVAWAAILLSFWAMQKRGGASRRLAFSSLHGLRNVPASAAQRLRPLWRGLRLVSVGLLCIASLRPQTTRPGTKTWSRGVDIMLAIDTSPSMQALDLDTDRPVTQRRNRLQVVKEVVADFVTKRPNDQLGMVVFGADAYTQCPLTLDHDILKSLLERVSAGMAGDSTAIGSGLAAAINRLRKSAAKSKVIILLTDGSNNSGALTPKRAASLANNFDMKVYTIGAANQGPAPFIYDTPFGKQVGKIEADLDEPTLKQIASITHGAYFRAEDSHALAAIYAKIDGMEKTDLHVKPLLEFDEHFVPWVWMALLTLLVEVIGLQTRLRAYP